MSFYEIIESYDLRRYFYSHYARLVLPKATYKNCSSKLVQLKSYGLNHKVQILGEGRKINQLIEGG